MSDITLFPLAIWFAPDISAQAAKIKPEASLHRLDRGLIGLVVVFVDGQEAAWCGANAGDHLEIRWTILSHNPFYHSTVAFRRSCFEAAGRYKVDESLFVVSHPAVLPRETLWSLSPATGGIRAD